MSLQRELEDGFGTTVWLIGEFAEGMTHAESMARPPFKANSFNWVLGHILVSRDRALQLLDQPPVLSESTRALYETGATPANAAVSVPLEDLLQALNESQARLTASLRDVSDSALAGVYDAERGTSIGDRLQGLHWHETYHLGQLEILRQVAKERPAFP